MLLHENIPALRVVIILLLVIPQAETRQGRRCLVPEKYGHEGRKGVPRGEFAQPAYTDIDQDPGQIRERARGRVHRRVLRRILAAGVQQVGAMEKSTWHGGTYIYTHTYIYLLFDAYRFQTDYLFYFFLLFFRPRPSDLSNIFFFVKNIRNRNTNGIFCKSKIWNGIFSFDSSNFWRWNFFLFQFRFCASYSLVWKRDPQVF